MGQDPDRSKFRLCVSFCFRQNGSTCYLRSFACIWSCFLRCCGCLSGLPDNHDAASHVETTPLAALSGPKQISPEDDYCVSWTCLEGSSDTGRSQVQAYGASFTELQVAALVDKLPGHTWSCGDSCCHRSCSRQILHPRLTESQNRQVQAGTSGGVSDADKHPQTQARFQDRTRSQIRIINLDVQTNWHHRFSCNPTAFVCGESEVQHKGLEASNSTIDFRSHVRAMQHCTNQTNPFLPMIARMPKHSDTSVASLGKVRKLLKSARTRVCVRCLCAKCP